MRYVFIGLLTLLLAACGDTTATPVSSYAGGDTSGGGNDTSTSGGTCGNGIVEAGEVCDGANLSGSSCETEGFSGGMLSCGSDCTFFATAGCSNCGNGIIEPGEACDGAELSGTCESEGFAYGDVACATDCTLDTSDCSATPPVCGDGLAQGDEVCDGEDFAGESCGSLGLGYNGGTLSCSNCTEVVTTSCYTCGNGVVEPGEVCDDGNQEDDFTCSPDCQSTCRPGFATCDNGVSRVCVDGTEVRAEVCDTLQASSCNDTTGRCTGPCSRSQLGTSYIGCDYFPTVTGNVTYRGFTFAAAVSNTSNEAADITITRGNNTVETRTVQPNSVEIIGMPWVIELKGGDEADRNGAVGNSVFVTDGAYRLRSTRPVTVYQFNPLEYKLGGCGSLDLRQCSFTNDASLLLPTHVWGQQYMVVGFPHWGALNYSGHYTVTAMEDGTTVNVNAGPTAVSFKPGVPGMANNGNGTVTLQSGDAFEMFTASGDPTGSVITSDKPIQVIAGHQCTNIPVNIPACDHLEESMYPFDSLSKTYVLTAPLVATTNAPKARIIRVVATQPNTTLTFDPPQSAPGSIASPGQFIEINTVADVVVTASEPVLVAEYMLGQNAGGNTGDPAFTLGISTDQYRDEYLFHAPNNYDTNYVNVVAETGTTVTLDGGDIANWTAIGSSGYSVARQQLSNSGDGNHRITSDREVGVTVYGYGQYTSYWYPGGSDVEQIIN